MLATISLLLLAEFTVTPATAAVVSTAQYNNFRDGANLNESVLNLFNVGTNTFGRIGSFTVDGEVRAQPLYVPSVVVNGVSTNVLFVATMHNSVYAFDATRPGSAPLWQINFGPAVPAFYASGSCPNSANTGPEVGILSTPVIDIPNAVLYAVYATTAGANSYTFYIAAIDIRTGQNKAGSPALITASVPGTGYDASGGTVSLNQKTYAQRPGLALSNGDVYVGFGSCGPDPDPYHGWVLGYSAGNVSVQTSAYNATPNGSEGAIWQSGRGLVVDNSGNVYASTGNGTNAFGCGNLSSCDASDSVIKFSPSGQPVGVYTDPNYAALSQYDLDLSSSGPLYVGSTGLILAGGKQGIMHVLNPSAIGRSNAVVQSFQATKPCGTYTVGGCFHITSLVYWDNAANPLLYVWGNLDTLRAYRWNGSQFNTTPDSQSAATTFYPGGIMALSANGSDPNTGILWAMTPDNIMHAFQATNVGTEIYNTNQNSSRDAPGTLSKFVVPTVADGHVYVATLNGQVQVYGLLGTTSGASASFVKLDSGTQGAWSKAYGAEGYNVIGDQAANPAYAAPSASGQSTYIWASSTADPRALQKASNPSDHVAATWYSGSSFLIDTNITDTNQHQVALYCLDWDTANRRQTIDVLDTSGNVLNTQTLTGSFYGGVYLVWNVTGHVIFRVTWNAGDNAVVEGIFFGGARQASPATAAFSRADTTTEGNWSTAYGAEGYNVIGDQAVNPPYAAPTASGQSTYIWASSTADPRALQKGSSLSDRVAAAWYSGSSFLIDTNITDTNQHQIALYCLDWDTTARRQTVDVLDTAGNVLNTQTLTTSFYGGVYLVWNVTGHVIFRVTWNAGYNGVVEGIFFGGAKQTSGVSAVFVTTDTATQGIWSKAYGAEGYNVIGDQALNPGYASPAASGQSTYVWASSTADPRALQKASNLSDHVAATWYSGNSFLIDTNITDTNQHQVALYCLDWDTTDRRQTIDVLDAAGNVLNTQSLTASFYGGVYLVWNVTGHVIFRVTWNAGDNGVVEGIFFGGPKQATLATASFSGTDTGTQGNWRTAYGADGYNVVGNTSSNPAYASPVTSGASTWVWSSSTADPRALQKANAGDRVAAAWYSASSFLIDTNISDGNQHEVALYCLDWETAARRQKIDVLDTAGNIIDTRTLSSSFNGGVYLAWSVTGHVIFRVTWTAGENAVVQGLFFGGASGQATLAGSASFLPPGTGNAPTLAVAWANSSSDTPTNSKWTRPLAALPWGGIPGLLFWPAPTSQMPLLTPHPDKFDGKRAGKLRERRRLQTRQRRH